MTELHITVRTKVQMGIDGDHSYVMVGLYEGIGNAPFPRITSYNVCYTKLLRRYVIYLTCHHPYQLALGVLSLVMQAA